MFARGKKEVNIVLLGYEHLDNSDYRLGCPYTVMVVWSSSIQMILKILAFIIIEQKVLSYHTYHIMSKYFC